MNKRKISKSLNDVDGPEEVPKKKSKLKKIKSFANAAMPYITMLS